MSDPINTDGLLIVRHGPDPFSLGTLDDFRRLTEIDPDFISHTASRQHIRSLLIDMVNELHRQHAEIERLTKERDEAVRIAGSYSPAKQLQRSLAQSKTSEKAVRNTLRTMTAERDALRAATTELIACLIDARDDVAAELQRCREAAGYPSTDRRLAAQETLIARVDAAIAASEDQPPAQPVKRLTPEQIVGLAIGAGVDSSDEDDDGATVFAIARAVEAACAAAWGVKLGEPA